MQCNYIYPGHRGGVRSARPAHMHMHMHAVHMHRLADLHLDTLPYNAHSTAADCTYATVPHLTVAGEQVCAPHEHDICAVCAQYVHSMIMFMCM